MNTNIITNNAEKCDYALIGLYEVDDPEIGLNVVDLGLIYELDFDDEQKELNARMTLTTHSVQWGKVLRLM
jgi:metal-sulfur cluster biosynthetic enzyme